jgi:hypothetical protein
MAVYVSNLVIYTGTDFEQVFVLDDAISNSALNLTDYTGSSQFRKYKSSQTPYTFDVTFTNRELGKVKIGMDATRTENLKPGKYFYDINITSPSGVTTRVVEGQVLVKKSVTR